MPPSLALLIGLTVVGYLLRIDSRQIKDDSSALWIPLAWMFFAGSRFLSQWLSIMGIPMPGADQVDGSPLDRIVFLFLMVAAIVVLRRRRVDWPRAFVDNKWIWLYFAFGLASVLWSAEPAVSFRRVPKAAGNVLMAMVILTEPRPSYGLGTVLRRLAYLTLPLSVVFNRYFPQISRQYSNHFGAQMLSGVGTQKNSLGELCLLAGIYCVWDLLYVRDQRVRAFGGLIPVEWIIAGLGAWLMVSANSTTSLVCLAVASVILVLGRTGLKENPAGMVAIVVAVSVSAIAADSLFGLFSTVIEMLGKRSDLTTRVPMWEQALATSPGSPVFGVGFEAYWVTAAGQATSAAWNIGNAHNGYLDAYLSSGLIGLGLIVLSLASGIIKVARHPPQDIGGAALRLAAIMAVILYNWTESAFRTVSTIWVLFLVAGMAVHASVVQATESASPAGPAEDFGPIGIHAWRRLKQGGLSVGGFTPHHE
jgi:O-antigen ligase